MVAGCSFSAISTTHPNSHWSELLATRLNLQLINYARQGCSNGGVRIAIDEIIRSSPDLAIIVPTFPGRFELPRDSAEYDWQGHTPSTGWAPPLENHIENKMPECGYNKNLGIRNINSGQSDYNFIVEPLFSLAENFPNPYRKKLRKETVEAIKQYISFLHDKSWKTETDKWIISQGISKLCDSNIKFLIMPGLLWKDSNEIQEYITKSVPTECIIRENGICPLQATNKFPLSGQQDPGYHGSPESQIYLASKIEQYINEIQLFDSCL